MTSKYSPTEEELDFADYSMPDLGSIPISDSKYSPTRNELDFADLALQEPISEEMPWYKSYASAAKKGLIKGTQGALEYFSQQANEDPFGSSGRQFGQVLGVDIMPKEFQEFKKEVEKKVPLSEEERENLNEQLKEKYPSKEGFVEGTISKTGELGIPALIGGGSLISKAIRSTIAGAAGQTAKELGIGKTGQSIVETLAFVSPDLSKKLIGKTPRQQKLMDLARETGLSESEIAPAIREDNFITKWLSKISYKGKSTQEKIQNSKDAIGEIFEYLETDPSANKKMEKNNLIDTMRNYAKAYFSLSPNTRKPLEKSFEEFMHSPGEAKDFIKFHKHVNADVPNPKKIQEFQEVTRKAVDKIDPQLGERFRMANELYSGVSKLGVKLTPPNVDTLQVTKGVAALYGLFTGNYELLFGALKAIGAQRIATQFLLNPRLQNIGQKTINAMNNNQVVLAKKYFNEFREEIKDTAPDFYNETSDIDFENLNPSKSNK